MSGGVGLQVGQRYELVSKRHGRLGEYELEHFEKETVGPLARLRNIETDGIASVTCRWLYEGDNQRGGRAAWRLVG